MPRHRAKVWVWLVVCGVAFIGAAACEAQKLSNRVAAGDRAGYVGDAACAECHRGLADSYAGTAHHLTSQLADATSILGSFEPGANVLMIADPQTALENPGLYFRMERHGDHFSETAVAGWPGKIIEHSASIDVVIGSGVRGQSYLSWRGDQLFELPVSYWSDGRRWINSPGYQNGTMDFSRPVLPRCLECHATWIRSRSSNPLSNIYDRSSLTPGISCETCHGPGRDHVTLERSTLSSAGRQSGGILNPKSLPRDRQIDICALCHNGLRDQQISPAFSFIPGQELGKFLQPDEAQLAQTPSVHGNQVGLLKKSRCYLGSPAMSCSTCHDIHAPEKPAAAYSARCLTCHRTEECGMSRTIGSGIAANCIDCHMPVEDTNAVFSQTAGDMIRPKMRSHWIRVYQPSAQPLTPR